MNKMILLIICFNFILSQDFIPENQTVLNYTQILFRWPQINGSDTYKIFFNNEDVYTTNKNSLIIENFEWSTDYFWTVCGFTEFDVMVDCYEEYTFSTSDLPDNYPDNTSIYTIDEFGYTPGITMLDYESLSFSVAIDSNGIPVWFSNRDNFYNSRILVTQFLPTGNIIGFGHGRGYEFNLDSEIIFETPIEYSIHHDIHKTDNGTYLFIDAEIENHPPPIEYSLIFPDEIPWKGDRFIEVDEGGDLLWDWNTFDCLNLNEYNPMWIEEYIEGGDWFNWTHSNSVFFDELSNNVYVSMRNLSRISAIDYSTKEIIWNLGNPDYMNQQYFENNFGFSHQHSAQINHNNNLLFFDNGRDNDPELSRCLEIEFFENEEPQLVWEYILPDSLLTLSRGECDRLSNNNTLISIGRTGNVIELDEENEVVWHFNAKTNSGAEVSIYRSERIVNLYPTAFSFSINNLEGLYGQYALTNSPENINLNIYNNGWISQNFKYQLFDMNNNVQNEDEINIFQNNQININIEIPNIETDFFILKVFPADNLDNFQEITFTNVVVNGDINGDGILDIVDIVLMINMVLGNEYNEVSDINEDGILNILDIVTLVNIILN